MSKARKDAAKKKSVAQKAATRAKKLQGFAPVVGGSSSANGATNGQSRTGLDDANSAQELFALATATIGNATTKAEYASAIQMLRQAIRVDPDQADYFVCLGTAYAHAEQHDFALAACEMALQLAPEHAVAAENRRHALKALGLPETTLIDRT
jgi:tetratricopeptide (TPR) repeat protein